MLVQEMSHNRRIASLGRLTRELGQSRTISQSMRILQHAFAEVEGFVASLFISTRGLEPGQYRVIQARWTEQLEGDVLDDPTREEQIPIVSGGIIGSVIRQREPQLLQNVDWSGDPLFSKTLAAHRSVIAIPIAGNRLPINWAILLKKVPGQFTTSDLEQTVERAALIGALLENQLLATELARAHEQIDRDARQVGDLQRALLPASVPRISGLEIAASYEPCGRAGGDLYDIFPLDESHGSSSSETVDDAPSSWCVLIGDASGHNLAAAVVMAIVQAVLLARPAGLDGPQALLRHANRQLCNKRIGGFFTAFLGIYESTSRRFTYANAGHPAPLLRRSISGESSPPSTSSSSLQSLDSVLSYPLGIDDTECFSEATVQLERGDTLLLYTDGITEARRAQEDLFGLERLERIVRESYDGPADLIDRLRAAVRAHQQWKPASDDQTLVAARVL
jgi:sigma-B regulation protein RsbU (phosphoserine phosphatase)